VRPRGESPFRRFASDKFVADFPRASAPAGEVVRCEAFGVIQTPLSGTVGPSLSWASMALGGVVLSNAVAVAVEFLQLGATRKWAQFLTEIGGVATESWCGKNELMRGTTIGRRR